jgi:hypothetical protein
MTLRWKLAAAGVAVVALVGASAAVAGIGHGAGHRRSAVAGGVAFAAPRGPGAFGRFGIRARGWFGAGPGLQAAADYLGVSVDTLRSDLRSGKTLAQEAQAQGKNVDGLVQALVADAKSKLDAAVKAGKLKQSQEDAITAKLQQLVTAMVNGTHPARPAFGLPGRPRLGGGGELQVAAAYLGISVDTLRSDLRSGKTLAQEAQAQGKKVDGLVQALVADAKSKLDAAVKAGKLTQSQEDAITAMLQQRITDRVNGTHPARPSGQGGWPHGWGKAHGWGQAPSGGANA